MFLRTLKRLTTFLVITGLLVATSAEAATPSAAVIGREMLKSLAKVNSLAFSGMVQMDSATTYSAKLKKEYEFYQDSKTSDKGTFSGFLDASDPTSGKLYMSIDIPDFEGMTNAGTAQLIVLNDEMYFNLTSDAIFNFLKNEGVDLSSLNGQWIGVTQDALKNFYTNTLGMDLNKFSAAKGSSLTPDQAKQVVKAIKDSGVMSFVKVADKAADAQGMYHMRINVNKNKVLNLVKKIIKISGEKALTATESRNVQREINQAQMPRIDMMVGKSDFLPHKITYTQTSKRTYSYGYTNSETITLTLELSGFNVPVNVSAPSSFKPFDQVVSEVQSMWQKQEEQSRRLSDLKQLQTALELYYNDQNAYPVGTGITLGGTNSSCLNASGWQPAGCTAPYMSFVPSPASSTYMYYASTSTYSIDATLDQDVGGLLKGKIRLTPSGITNL